ncbi:MAG: hypothetical protein IH861_02890 [Chloroflexi bacterium]|nr:hypothetical protein [Chloroflexota bacterium]
MAIMLTVILLGVYLTVGLVAKDYNWWVRLALLAITFGAPPWYFFFF